MTKPVFVANLILAFIGIALCFDHARDDRDRLTFLATAIVYGIMLEQLVILRFEAYHYNVNDFILTLGDVPIVIGLGWAAIIYSGYQIGQRLEVSSRVLVLFVGLFGLHIDLAIDAIAIRVPFWTWTPPGIWFGVPLGNFMGWFLVGSLFTVAWLFIYPRISFEPLAGLLSLAVALVLLVVLLQTWVEIATTPTRRAIILGAVVALSLWVVIRNGITFNPIDVRVAAVPFLYHGFYLVLLLSLGMFREQPLLLVISLAMAGVSGILHAGELMRSPRELVAPPFSR